jgi:FixJ family two-component response regulator
MGSGVNQFIAVVDDDAGVRDSLTNLIEAFGYTCSPFSSAEEFLAADCLSKLHCLITDVRLPGIDGLELQRRVKFERPDLSVIFITANQDKYVERQAIEEGAICFLYKPPDTTELLRVIETTPRGSAGAD